MTLYNRLRQNVSQVYKWLRSIFFKIIKWAQSVKIICYAAYRSGVQRLAWILTYVENCQGGYESFKRKMPFDHKNAPLPWYTYPAIEYLQHLDFSKCDVFEYGSGNSSKFWASRANSVTSVESDASWYKKGAEELFPDQDITLKVDKEEYVNAIHNKGVLYEVIVVDGIYRYNCVVEALKKIQAGGIIILDNSERTPNAAKLLRENGFTQIDFIGMGPINSYAWCTSVFYKGHISIPRKSENINVIGGIVNISDEDVLV